MVHAIFLDVALGKDFDTFLVGALFCPCFSITGIGQLVFFKVPKNQMAWFKYGDLVR